MRSSQLVNKKLMHDYLLEKESESLEYEHYFDIGYADGWDGFERKDMHDEQTQRWYDEGFEHGSMR